MRVYQFAREINRPHRGVVQLLRELGFDVPSHMARLDDDQEYALREAVDRQSRGAVAVRPALSSSAAIEAAQVAEIEAPADLEDEYAQEGAIEGDYGDAGADQGQPEYADDSSVGVSEFDLNGTEAPEHPAPIGEAEPAHEAAAPAPSEEPVAAPEAPAPTDAATASVGAVASPAATAEAVSAVPANAASESLSPAPVAAAAVAPGSVSAQPASTSSPSAVTEAPVGASGPATSPSSPTTPTPIPTPALARPTAGATSAAPAPAPGAPIAATGITPTPLKPGVTRSGTKPGTLLGTLAGFEPQPSRGSSVSRPGGPVAPGAARPGQPVTQQRPGTPPGPTVRTGVGTPPQRPGAPGTAPRTAPQGFVPRPGAPGMAPRPGQPGQMQRPGTGVPGRPGTFPGARPGVPAATRPGTAPIRPGMPRPGMPGPAASAARKPVKAIAPAKRRDKEEVLQDFEKEGIREQIEMVDTVVGAGTAGTPAAAAPTTPAGPTPGFEPGKLLRTVDLSAVEDPAAPVVKRRAVVNVGGRQIRTLQRRRQRGPKISIQATQELHVQTPINLKDFSQVTGVVANDMIKRLILTTGQLTWNLNSVLDEERVKFLSEAFGRKVVVNQEQSAEDLLEAETDEADEQAEGDLESRPAVVAILGHVDHGKTSLLDRIRNSNRVAQEFGGITQHIGAFQVPTSDGRKVAFLDTPGHAAFTAMRARGAKAADIVVLVVAADDGVMPQTEESITHATQAECPIVVALNKIDKPSANPTRVMQQLSAHGLTPEEWGGDTIFCKVSALKGDGVPEMIENLAALAEVMELKANPKAPPRGRVIEARKDPNRGVIATLLVEEGTLRKGDAVVAGLAMGRVRTMLDDLGRTVKEAGPSTPIEVFGLDELPDAGDEFMVVENERLARSAVDERRQKLRDATVLQREMPSLEKLFAQAAAGGPGPDGSASKDLRIILKCDVKGSLEPIKGEIAKLRHPEVAVNLLYSGMGAITKSDVDNAVSSGAVILGFHVLSESAARKEAERTSVEIRHYTVIYELVDDLRAAMERKLAPEKKEHTTGHAEVRQVFQSSKVGTIAGCYVIDGTVHRTDFVRVYRDGRLIFGQERQIPVESLKRFKDDVREVREGFECGLRIAAYQDVKEGDVLEFYEIREEQRKLVTT